MDSIKSFFSRMNDINYEYVVLRNWEELPYDVTLGEHSDLDILVRDFDHWCEIFPTAHPEYKLPRVRMKVPIDDSYIYVDVRHVGDDYYPIDFERAILDTKEWNSRGFFTPDPLHHRIALAYHAVHHKGGIAPEYVKYLGDAQVPDLLEALKQSGVGWIEPKDKTVGKFNPYWKGATSVVNRRNGWIFKTQTSYKDYPLIANEKDILSGLDSIHFPRLGTSMSEDEIVLEDCGELLNVTNLPSNWEIQLDQILLDLNNSQICHRDIKLDNLMVKDGVIKLIDFGWAVTIPSRGCQFEKLETTPPSCLGFPNKPSDGFSDQFSMRCVRKQIEFMLEEALV